VGYGVDWIKGVYRVVRAASGTANRQSSPSPFTPYMWDRQPLRGNLNHFVGVKYDREKHIVSSDSGSIICRATIRISGYKKCDKKSTNITLL